MKSLIVLLLFFYTLPASSNIEDFRPGTWNLQGTKASTENMWIAHIKGLFVISTNNQNYRDIMSLQEVSEAPSSAEPIISGNDFIPESDPFSTNIVVHQYRWSLGTSRVTPQTVYIYLADVAARVNVAIVSSRRPDSILILPSPRSGYHAARPMLGAVFGNTVFYSVHAISGQNRSDADDIIKIIYNYHMNNPSPAIRQMQWMAMGDFNLEPVIMYSRLRASQPQIADDIQIVYPDDLTQTSGRTLDYAVVGPFNQPSVPNIAASFLQASRTNQLGSDHYPVNFHCEL